MASTVPPQEAVGQPVFVQPDVAAVSSVPVEPGTAYCYPQAQIPGALLLQQPVSVNIMKQQPPKEPSVYEYKPSSYLSLSIFTLIACGVFSPLTLTLSIPALLLSIKSLQNTKRDSIQKAWLQGVVAAHLNVAAITAALMLACLATGMIIRFQAETFAINTCLNTVRQRLGGEIPTPASVAAGHISYDC